MRATDEQVRAAFHEYLVKSNLPTHIKNGDYRSGFVRQAWASFYAGWRMSENALLRQREVVE